MKIPALWRKIGNKSLQRTVRCKDFMSAVRLIGRIARLAERVGHHPDLHLTGYRRLRIALTTHSAGKVTAKDLSMASKISKLIAILL